MALKIRIPKRKPASARRPSTSRNHFTFSDPAVKIAVAVFVTVGIVFASIFAVYWVRYDRIVEHRINAGLFKRSSRIYARPTEVWVGQKLSAEEISASLRRAGYNQKDSTVGTYRMLTGGIEIKPGPESFHSSDGAIIRISDGKVQKIVGTGGSEGANLDAYELEPELITALGSQERAKRQLVRYEDIPKVMVNAVLAIEDRRFFEHSGINFLRFLQAAWIDLREGGQKRQGGSTITMQVSRKFFLTPEKTIKRKLVEMLISVELEQKLTKQQIFEMYANESDMGQRGSYAIVGFAEASRAYFNKELQSITLPEAALLAGMLQAPSYLNPYRHPERALERRNLVLDAMVETGAIRRDQAEEAKAVPLKLAPLNVEASDAPYFVDLVKDTITGKLGDQAADEALRIYTTLDPDLQRAAAEAVQIGIKNVDEQVTKMRTRRIRVGKGKAAKTEIKVMPGPQAQVALVAIDPHTGEVLALVGGRNYGWSQLNHALARRPVGSVFKPFVYAAALNTALDGDPQNALTPASMIDDSPTTFTYGDQIYEPRNYKDEYFGLV
ncbi:MAG TPA: transglycosylase domain-containing protein, partial [Terriglobales bacterium]|nr:transglycosylase domain-containing protein [Terriglobales bacterium]